MQVCAQKSARTVLLGLLSVIFSARSYADCESKYDADINNCLAAFQATMVPCEDARDNSNTIADLQHASAYAICDNTYNTSGTICQNNRTTSENIAQNNFAGYAASIPFNDPNYMEKFTVCIIAKQTSLANAEDTYNGCLANASTARDGCYANADTERGLAQNLADLAFDNCSNGAWNSLFACLGDAYSGYQACLSENAGS